MIRERYIMQSGPNCLNMNGNTVRIINSTEVCFFYEMRITDFDYWTTISRSKWTVSTTETVLSLNNKNGQTHRSNFGQYLDFPKWDFDAVWTRYPAIYWQYLTKFSLWNKFWGRNHSKKFNSNQLQCDDVRRFLGWDKILPKSKIF